MVGEGITGSPVIGPVNCPIRRQRAEGRRDLRRRARHTSSTRTAPRATASRPTPGRPQDNALQTDFAVGTGKFDTPTIPAVGHPAFGDLIAGRHRRFLAPAAGVIRALDLAVNEYQGGQDFVAGLRHHDRPVPARLAQPGQRPLSSSPGPSVGDVDGLPGRGGRRRHRVARPVRHSPRPARRSPGFPKLTADWTVANPALGSLGTFDVDAAARKVLVGADAHRDAARLRHRRPVVLARLVAAVPPRQRELRRLQPRRGARPGKPYDIALDASNNDHLQGARRRPACAAPSTTTRSCSPTARSRRRNFASQEPASGAPAPTAPGTTQSMQIPPERRRFVAIRAVDEQGNVGPPAVTEIPNYVRPKGATPLRVSLVPAFQACTSPNRTHGPPLAHPSCAPPQQVSPQLTVGAPDANGKPVAVDRIGAHGRRGRRSRRRRPSTRRTCSSSVSITDVRKRSDLSDYTGELAADAAGADHRPLQRAVADRARHHAGLAVPGHRALRRDRRRRGRDLLGRPPRSTP